jgi:hypothetical protein
MGCELVEQESVSPDEPWRCRPIDQEQQYADKTQDDQAVAMLFSILIQVRVLYITWEV